MNGAGETARKPLKYTSKTQVCWHSRNRLQNRDHLSFVYEKTEKDGGTTGDTFLLFACTFYVLYTKQVTWVRDSFLKTGPGCPVPSCLWPGRSARSEEGWLVSPRPTCKAAPAPWLCGRQRHILLPSMVLTGSLLLPSSENGGLGYLSHPTSCCLRGQTGSEGPILAGRSPPVHKPPRP